MQARLCSCASLGVGTWLLTCPTTLTFYLSSTHFLTTLSTCFDLSHPTFTHFSQCQCGHTIDDLNTHLLWCPCEREHTTTHDTLWDIVVTIVLENGAHFQWKVSHLFPCHTQQWMDILIIKDYFWTSMHIVTIDPTCTDIVQWTLTISTHATMMVGQKKRWSDVEWTPSDDFIPLSIVKYGCFHFSFHPFFITCAQTTAALHQWSLVPSMFVSYYQQHVSIALQCAQAIMILLPAFTLGQGFSLLPHIMSLQWI
jgi:hypothetical protein